MKRFLFFAICGFVGVTNAFSQNTTISFNNGLDFEGFTFQQFDGTPLPQDSLVEFGILDTTIGFTSYTAFIGPGGPSANSEFIPRIGDNAGGVGDRSDGYITSSYSLTASDFVPSAGSNLVFAVRIFDTTDIANATTELSLYNTVYASNWTWFGPGILNSYAIGALGTPPASLVWEAGGADAFRATIPEPSSLMLLLVGGMVGFMRRRRR